MLIVDFSNVIVGIISLAQYLDYEKVKDYLLTVQATDRGTPPLSNQATVNISVLDFNDNRPMFTQESYSARISEDIAIGDIAVKVRLHILPLKSTSKYPALNYLFSSGNCQRFGQRSKW